MHCSWLEGDSVGCVGRCCLLCEEAEQKSQAHNPLLHLVEIQACSV